MADAVKRVILRGTRDLSAQASAAELAMGHNPEAKPGTIIGIRRYGMFFGVRWNKNSVSVYPQRREGEGQ